MSSAAPSSTPSSVAMLQHTSVSKKLKIDEEIGSPIFVIMRIDIYVEKLFQYLEEPHLSNTCSLFRKKLVKHIMKRDEELVKRHEKHYELAVLTCGVWKDKRSAYDPRPFFKILLEPALHDMMHMYNTNIAIHMLRGTIDKSIMNEIDQKWGHVQLFFRCIFEDVEEVTEAMLRCGVVGRWYTTHPTGTTELDLNSARRLLSTYYDHFMTEYERVQRKHAADLTSDEE